MVKRENPQYWQENPSPIKLRYLNRYSLGDSALDIGTGAGYYANELISKGIWVVGIDLEPRANYDFPCIQGRISAIPLGNRFDTVIAFDVLEHEREEQRALEELWRVTGKRLILSVPNADDHLLTTYNLTFKHHIDKTHLRVYEVSELRRKLETAGFRVRTLQLDGPVSPAFLAEFVPRWLSGMTRFLLKGLFRMGILRNSALMADIYVVADRIR